MIYFITNNKIYEVNLKFLLNPFFVLFLDVLNLEISHKKCNMIANMIKRKLKSAIKNSCLSKCLGYHNLLVKFSFKNFHNLCNVFLLKYNCSM